MERYIVDRIEGALAVLESDDMAYHDAPVADLPEGVKRGDCLEREGDSWRIDEVRTEERRVRLEKLRRSLAR